MTDLKADFQYYLDHKSDLLSKYQGKYIAIKNKQVIGIFDDRIQAIEETQRTHELGSFIVQLVSESGEDQVRFHSRVAI